jgi:Toastrack DUF4097
MKSITKLFTIALLLAIPFGGLFAQKESAEKSFQKEFEVNADAMLKVSNKHGSLEIENWEKNKVAVFVTIQTRAASNEKATKILNSIDVEVSGSKELVEVITSFDKHNCRGKCSIEVNIMIKMPKSLNVDLAMAYGKMFIQEIDGQAKLGVKYGAMSVDKLNNENVKIFVKYSDASIDHVNKAEINVAYSNLSIDDAKVLKVQSSYGKVEIDDVYSLAIKSQYDELEIDKAGSVALDSKFTNVEIDKLDMELMVENAYGNVEVDYISAGFNQIKVKTSYGNVSLGIDENASYTLDAEAKYGSISYPKSRAHLSMESNSHVVSKYTGTIGSDKAPKSSVIIECKNASVSLY